MTKLNLMDRIASRGSCPETHRVRSTRSVIVRLGLLALLMTFALGNRDCSAVKIPTITCEDVVVRVAPGSCAQFQNPCGGGPWTTNDGFALKPTEEQGRIYGPYVQTTSFNDDISRSVCVRWGPPVLDEPIRFYYSRGREDFGEGFVRLMVAAPLTVEMRPDRLSLSLGDSTQLVANVHGGTPPYFYSWTPGDSLNDNDIVAPQATPGRTTTYTVTVRDSAGEEAVSSVTVDVITELLRADATANPSLISLGDTSQLDVSVTGGFPPYTYVWSEVNPASSLSDPFSKNPVASPTVTTSYSVTVTDSVGHTDADNVTVNVASSPPPPTASFVFNVLCCPTLHLDASASTGHIVSYTWDLGWTTTSPDRMTSSPLTSFTMREFDRGTVQLTVTDAAGRTATMTRNF